MAVALNWVHGSTVFEMVSDAIVYIMSKRGFKIFAYIDGFVAILPCNMAHEAFQALCELIRELGLPINPEKMTSPCLSSLALAFISIWKPINFEKLKAIHEGCLLTRLKKHLSRKDSSPS